ncbi:tRNA (uracil-5-)-methyltransferase [Enterococcus hulanensis]|uniref:tRNA (uracil-5-)-methyltransferase n=1 Tax=Enterococcus hulanensis TaxID=2559929 RepID=UPI0010F501AE|nr:tRNA (uracil-5-)-methyltransferase [Enterococcus hulanensis]MBO0458326.1 tRNA (uracil-5-)-methyltransferase [Enterococcus hulanensis]
MDKKKVMIASLAIIVLLIIASKGYSHFKKKVDLMNIDSSAVDWNGKKNKESANQEATIAIPGFEKVTLKAKETKQEVNFHNPETNDCYFKLSLIHPNGSVLWTSNLIEPGKGMYEIELKETLSEGEYEDTILKYECFSLTDQSPLNGTEINLKLVVV